MQIASIVSASRYLNPKFVLAVRELRQVDVFPSQYTMLPLNQLTHVFMCSFTSFGSLTLWHKLAIILLHYTTLGLGNSSSCLGKTFMTSERLADCHLCSSSLMLKGRPQGWCGHVVSLGLDLCWTGVTICCYKFCTWTHLHCTLSVTPLGLVLRGCLKQITRPHQHCGHTSGLAVSRWSQHLRIVRQQRGMAGNTAVETTWIRSVPSSPHTTLMQTKFVTDWPFSIKDDQHDWHLARHSHIPNVFLNPEDAFPGDVEFNKINGQFR